MPKKDINNKKDLSYDARSTRRRESLIDLIASINDTLKYERLSVVLESSGNTLRLRYADDTGKWRGRSPKGVDLSAYGIDKARQLAFKLGHAVRSGIYTEEWYLREISGRYTSELVEPEVPLLWGEVLSGFSEQWLRYRGEDKSSTERQKQVTLKYYSKKLTVIDRELNIPHDEVFDADLVTRLLAGYSEGTDKRFRARESLSLACSLYGITYSFKGIGKRPKPARREIPSDKLIVETWDIFSKILQHPNSNPDIVRGYRWLYSVLVTYGLRPQELFAIDLERSFRIESDYWLYLDESLMNGLKTGSRQVAPLHPEWFFKFDIATVIYPPLADDYDSKVRALNRYFTSHKIPFKPYDARHAFAIRCRLLGIELLDAAALMGHDPATHIKTYQQWIGMDEKRKSVNAALERNRSSPLLE